MPTAHPDLPKSLVAPARLTRRAFLPRFHYHHQPAGSPPQRFSGLDPTGPLPESIDFALVPRHEPDRFKALFCGDPQPRDLDKVEAVDPRFLRVRESR